MAWVRRAEAKEPRAVNPTPFKTYLGGPPLRELDALSGPLDGSVFDATVFDVTVFDVTIFDVTVLAMIWAIFDRTDFESSRLRIEPNWVQSSWRPLVEPRGIEPLTSAVRLQRSPI